MKIDIYLINDIISILNEFNFCHSLLYLTLLKGEAFPKDTPPTPTSACSAMRI